jgi:saccharopine dehydrogenase-like NADP-dependent oxidoreductase
MKIAVMGGLGMQGRAALADLDRSEPVTGIVCADVSLEGFPEVKRILGLSDRVVTAQLDASSPEVLADFLGNGFDAAIDLLPMPLMPAAFKAGIAARVPVVSTNYAHTVRDLHDPARRAGVTLMPECGLDPGIDLVLCGNTLRQFDTVHVVNSYCGGIPAREACTNPLNYKISWNWEMVLRSQMRPARFLQNGEVVAVSAEEQHENPMIHNISVTGIGELEAVPNGDAVFYADLLGISGMVREAGRYSLRWPGWCRFWAPLKRLGFLSEDPVPGIPGRVSPRDFLVAHLGPRLAYADDEKDLAVMVNVFEGLKDGKRKTVRNSLVIERDLDTGLFAMAKGVGFTASIVAQMLASGAVNAGGLRNPAVDVPYESFLEALAKRGIYTETASSVG